MTRSGASMRVSTSVLRLVAKNDTVVQQGEGGWQEIVTSHKAVTSQSMSEDGHALA
jgi:hypothetical protein